MPSLEEHRRSAAAVYSPLEFELQAELFADASSTLWPVTNCRGTTGGIQIRIQIPSISMDRLTSKCHFFKQTMIIITYIHIHNIYTYTRLRKWDIGCFKSHKNKHRRIPTPRRRCCRRLGAALGAGALGVGLGCAAAWKGQKPYGI